MIPLHIFTLSCWLVYILCILIIDSVNWQANNKKKDTRFSV